MPDDQTHAHPDLAATDATDAPAGHGPVAALRLQVNRQQGRLDAQSAQLQEQAHQIARLAGTLRDSDARVARLAQEAQALRQQIADIRGSTSWRITGPLRALRRGGWWLGGLLAGLLGSLLAGRRG